MKNSKILAFLLFGLVLILAACGSSDSSKSEGDKKDGDNKDEKTYVIGATQIVEHPSLNAAYEGFKKALADAGIKAEFKFQNAQNDATLSTTIAQNFVNDGVDLIFANSTPSAQAAASATKDIPIVFTSVSDPVGAQLIQSMESPGGNVTGTVDLHPEVIKTTVEFMNKELGAKKIGTIYKASEQNSVVQVKQMKDAAKAVGATIHEATVANSSEVKQAAESLADKVDAIYIITDNTVVSTLSSVVDVATANKLPLVVGEFDSVRGGGLLAFGFEYSDIGYQAGKMAAQILKGEKKPSEIPAEYPEKLKLLVNKKYAKQLGIEIKDSWNAEIAE